MQWTRLRSSCSPLDGPEHLPKPVSGQEEWLLHGAGDEAPAAPLWKSGGGGRLRALLAALVERILLQRLREREHELCTRRLARAKEPADEVLHRPTAARWIVMPHRAHRAAHQLGIVSRLDPGQEPAEITASLRFA